MPKKTAMTSPMMKSEPIRKVWKWRQGNTAIIDGVADVMSRTISPEQKYYLHQLGNGYIFAEKTEKFLNLWAFGLYESSVLPHDLLKEFVMLLPAGTELVRPEKPKKERDFNINPLK